MSFKRTPKPRAPRKAKQPRKAKHLQDVSVAAAVAVVDGEPVEMRVTPKRERMLKVPDGVGVYRDLRGMNGLSILGKLSQAKVYRAFQRLGYCISESGEVEFRGEDEHLTADERKAAEYLTNMAIGKLLPNIKLILSDAGNEQSRKESSAAAREYLERKRIAQRASFPDLTSALPKTNGHGVSGNGREVRPGNGTEPPHNGNGTESPDRGIHRGDGAEAGE